MSSASGRLKSFWRTEIRQSIARRKGGRCFAGEKKAYDKLVKTKGEKQASEQEALCMRAFMVIKGLLVVWKIPAGMANKASGQLLRQQSPDSSRKWAIALAGRVCADMWRIFQHLHRAMPLYFPAQEVNGQSVPLGALKSKRQKRGKAVAKSWEKIWQSHRNRSSPSERNWIAWSRKQQQYPGMASWLSKQTIMALAPTLERDEKQGFELAEIVSRLHEKGIEVKPQTLAKYLCGSQTAKGG